MYSGTTIRRGSGKFVGVHQKIDRASRRHIKRYLPDSIQFPTIKEILHFEGNNGPDGIKRKSPSVDEPWHFIDPNNADDKALIDIINDHIYNMSVALRVNNRVRASFEAAWSAHAVVDGLTPAHHYPLGDKIEELWGKAHSERNTIKDKYIIHGENFRDTLSKNWQYWGTDGVFTTHNLFEMGVAAAIATENFKDVGFNKFMINKLSRDGFESIFNDALHTINDMNLYEQVAKKGWTKDYAKAVRQELIPEIIKVVILAWYQAIIMATE